MQPTLRVTDWIRPNRIATRLARVLGFLAITSSGASAQPHVVTQPDTSCKPEIEKMRAASNAQDSADARKFLLPCIVDNDETNRQVRLKQTEAEVLRLARMYLDIPEYHDEGRLPVERDSTGLLLGPLAGIYASPFLHGFTRPSQIYEQGLPGTLAAIVVVDEKPGAVLPKSYTNLRLQPGMNCIWLYVEPPPDGMTPARYLSNLQFSARVSHPAGESACDRAAPMNRLPVVAVRIKGFGSNNDYPAVARFATDRLGIPILGVKCLNAFCEIGVGSEKDVRTPDGLAPVQPNYPQWKPMPGVSKPRARRQVVKGWHDEQTLAIRGADYRWRASDVRARITPDPAAASYDSADFHNQWRRVATILIVGDVPKESKYYGWGLRHGLNHMQFRYDATARLWEARLVREGSEPKPWKFMVRVVHHDVSVPPIVRFRWTGADDGVWAPCGNACCKTDDGT